MRDWERACSPTGVTTRQGAPKPDFLLNRPEAQGCQILVAGRNLGCGSSREHAPWALLDYGFRAVVSTEIADIFRNNSLKNGLLPVVVDEATSSWLIENPGAEVTIDLESTTLTLPTGQRVQFPIEAFSRYCLLNGIDELGFPARAHGRDQGLRAARMKAQIAVLGGDGIGPEVVAEGLRVLRAVGTDLRSRVRD